MDKISPEYLAAVAEQLGSLSAFLGGFAATFLATLLTFGAQGRVWTSAVALAAASAVAFIVVVVASSMLVAMLHPQAPAILARSAASIPRAIMSLAFGIGIFSLLLSIATSGWLRSRSAGMITTGISVVGIILVGLLTVRIG